MPDHRWVEVTVENEPEMAEAVSAALMAAGANGVVFLGCGSKETAGDWASPISTTPAGVRAYLPADDLLGERMELLRDRLAAAAREWPPAPPARISMRPLVETDWEEAWKEYFRPLVIGRIVVVPSWEDYTPAEGETMLRIDPGMAFGAGTHPTTQQSLLLLQEFLFPGDRVLDVGTGCGILAIAAARLRAGPVLARDVDGMAVAVARENAVRNGVASRIEVGEGDLLTGLNREFDLVLANLIAPLLLEMLPDLPRVLAPGALAIVAGVIRERAKDVRDAARQQGLDLLRESTDGEWVAMAVRRTGDPG